MVLMSKVSVAIKVIFFFFLYIFIVGQCAVLLDNNVFNTKENSLECINVSH